MMFRPYRDSAFLRARRLRGNFTRAFRTGLRPGLVLALGLLAGCMDMFDPTGGAYARGRYTENDAFVVTATVAEGDRRVYRLQAAHPEGRPKLRRVWLIAITPAQEKVDRQIPYTLTPGGELEFAVTVAQQEAYGGVHLWGSYAQPELAMAGARSIEIVQTVRFPGK